MPLAKQASRLSFSLSLFCLGLLAQKEAVMLVIEQMGTVLLGEKPADQVSLCSILECLTLKITKLFSYIIQGYYYKKCRSEPLSLWADLILSYFFAFLTKSFYRSIIEYTLTWLFHDCKYVIVIVRKGLNRVQKWIPYFYNTFSSTYIDQRYNVKSQKPTTHVQQFKQLQELVFTNSSKIAHLTTSKAVLLPQLSGLDLKEISEKDLYHIFQRHLSWIKGYISFVVQAYQQPITILYRFRQNGLALKSELAEIKKYVQLISIDQLTEKLAKNTILMLEPYLIKEEDIAKFTIRKILALTYRLEYFKLGFDQKMKHLELQIIYPNLYQNIELNMQRSTYRKKIPPQRKIIVYYEKDEDETEIIPSNNKKSEFTKKCDENMSETCEEIQCSKEKTAVKSFQAQKKEEELETKNKDQSKSIPTTFNMFSIQINPNPEIKTAPKIIRSKSKGSK